MTDTNTPQLPLTKRSSVAREDIERSLRERPTRSNRQVAADLGCDHGRVGEVRKELEASGLPRVTHTVGADGKTYPLAPTSPPPSPTGDERPPPPSLPPAFLRQSTTCDDRFDWNPESNPDVVVEEQLSTAVYLNTRGAVVIRQEKTTYEREDVWVVIGLDALPAVIDRLQALLSAEE